LDLSIDFRSDIKVNVEKGRKITEVHYYFIH